MSFFKGVFGAGRGQPPPAGGRGAAPPPAASNVPPGGGFGPPVVVGPPAGFAPPPNVHQSVNQRPTAQSLAQARAARSAGLAGAVFGGPPAPLSQSTVQPQLAHPQQQYSGQPYGGGPGGIPGGPPAPAAATPTSSGGGGDMFDMFGGLEVKASDAPAAAAPAGEEASGFSFLSEDSSGADTNGYDASAGYVPDATAYSVPTPAPVPTPTAAISSSESDRLRSTMSYFDRCLSIFWQEWRALIANQSQLKQEEVQLQLSVRRDTEAVKQTEEKQAAAVAAEEYEKADTYNAEMERLHHTIQQSRDRLIRTRQEIDAREQQKTTAAQKILSILQETQQSFNGLSTTKQAELSVFTQTQLTSLQQKDKQVNVDLERVNHALSHTQQNLDVLQQEEDSMTRALSAETSPFIEEKQQLADKEHTLLRELEELKQRVIQKEREIVENREKQHSADRAVDVIRTKFTQQRSSIAEKKRSIDQLRSRDVNEKREIENRARLLDKEIQRNKLKELEYRTYLHDIAKQLAHANYVQTFIANDQSHRQAYHTQYQTDVTQISQLQHELNNYESNLASIRNELVNVEQAVEQHRNNINTITQKIPTMEQEKNAAVTARDFKKAAAASKEIKTLQQSKADSEAAIEELKTQVAKHRDTLATADQKKLFIAQEVQRLEEQVDRKRLHYLLLTESQLTQRQQSTTLALQQAYNQTHTPATTAAITAVSPLTEHLQKEIESLDVEIKWIQVEIRELRSKHQWGNDVGKLTVNDQWEVVEEAVVVNHVSDPSPFDAIKQSGNINNNVTQNGTPLGIPIINSPVRKSSSGALSPFAGLSAASFSPVSPIKKNKAPTAADVAALRSTLNKAQQTLADYEAKSAASIEDGNYDAAAELEDKIANEKKNVDKLEQQLASMIKDLPADVRKEVESSNNTSTTSAAAAAGVVSKASTNAAVTPGGAAGGVSIEDDVFADEQ